MTGFSGPPIQHKQLQYLIMFENVKQKLIYNVKFNNYLSILQITQVNSYFKYTFLSNGRLKQVATCTWCAKKTYPKIQDYICILGKAMLILNDTQVS